MKIGVLNRLTLVLAFVVAANINCALAQEAKAKLSFGVESEIMTWINKGYHGSFWIGKKRIACPLCVS